MIVILIVLVACQPDYIDSRQMHGVVKSVTLVKVDINDGIYSYDAVPTKIATGDTLVYVIRNYKLNDENPLKLLIVKSINGSIIE